MFQQSKPLYNPGHRSWKSVPSTPSLLDFTSDIEPLRTLRVSLPPLATPTNADVNRDECDKYTIKQSKMAPSWSLCLSEGYINAVRSRLGGLFFRQFVTITKKYELDTIDLWRAMSDISDLLVREIDLLLEFNAFLPSGYSFEFQPDGTVVQLSPTQHVLLSQSWNERGEPSPLPVPPSKESFKSSYRSSMNRSKQALDEMHLEIEDLSGSVRKLSSEPTFHGTFSQVYRGKCNSAQVAIKSLRALPGVSLHTMRRKIKRETVVWWTLFHPNIVPLLGFAEDIGDFGSLISPWYKNGNATEYIRQTRPSTRERLLLWHGVSKAIEYLHSESPSIVHGDLKPANVLIDDRGIPRVCDFGLTRLLSAAGDSGLTTTSQFSGTARYLARELVGSDDPTPTTASDVHALGCIGYEFIYNTTPYSNRSAASNPSQIYLDIYNNVPPAKRPRNALQGETGLLWDVLELCWGIDPNFRPSSLWVSKYSREANDALVKELGV